MKTLSKVFLALVLCLMLSLSLLSMGASAHQASHATLGVCPQGQHGVWNPNDGMYDCVPD